MTNATLNGKPYAGNPHVRFEAGGSRIGKARRGSLLYNKVFIVGSAILALVSGSPAAQDVFCCDMAEDYARYVDVFTGTAATGHTTPAAATFACRQRSWGPRGSSTTSISSSARLQFSLTERRG